MTPAVLMAIMLILGLVLCALLVSIMRQLRSRAGRPGIGEDTPMSSCPGSTAPIAAEEPDPGQGERLPRVVGRQRQLKALSKGGGDPSAAERLMDSGAYASCERRLEQAFDAYSQGRISLDTYETMVRAEGERAKRLRAEFRAKELAGHATANVLDDLREQIETIEIAVQWCLDWAEDLRSGTSADARQIAAGEN